MKLILNYFSFFLFVFLLSCSPRKQEIEYIEFEHKCFMLKKSDRIFVRFFPKFYNGKKRIFVELNFHGKEYASKFISRKDYDELVESIIEIEDNEVVINEVRNELGEKPVVITRTDGGYSTIEFRKGNFEKKVMLSELKNNEDELKNAVFLLTKTTGIDIKSIK